MKFLHTSDLHIGLRLKNYDLYEEQKDVLNQMINAVKKYKPDAFIIAGDIYDKSIPSSDAVHLFDEFITGLKNALPQMAIMMISGNHDSRQRTGCYGRILSNQKIYVSTGLTEDEGEISDNQMEQSENIHFIKIELNDEFGKVNFYLVPFIKPAYVRHILLEDGLSYEEAFKKMILRENIDYSDRNVLVSHQFFINRKNNEEVERMPSEIVTVGNIDAISSETIMRFDYAALGHIHKPMKAGAEHLRYCGTPFPYSIDEAGQEKGILLVTMNGKNDDIIIEEIPLVPLHNVRKISGKLEDVLKEKSSDFVSITITDDEDLDTVDMQVKLKANYERLCEIRRSASKIREYEKFDLTDLEDELEPFDMFSAFYKDMSDDEKEIVQEVINEVTGRA